LDEDQEGRAYHDHEQEEEKRRKGRRNKRQVGDLAAVIQNLPPFL
jgi:hypothetical protein